MSCRKLALNAELERVIQKTVQLQHHVSKAESEEERITSDLASTNIAICPLQLDVDKLRFLLQGFMELDPGLTPSITTGYGATSTWPGLPTVGKAD